jgi:subtilase family serine protease
MKISTIFLLIVALVALTNVTTCVHAKKSQKTQWTSVGTNGYSLHRFTIALHPNYEGVRKLEHLILTELSNIDSPNYGTYLSIDEVNTMTAAPQKVRNHNIKWLGSHNIGCKDYYDNLVCVGLTSKINEVFRTDIKKHINSETSHTVRISLKPYAIPQELEGVAFVDGLSNALRPHFSPKTNVKAHPTVDSGYVALEVMSRMYNLNPTFTDQVGNGVPQNPISPEHLIGQNGKISDGESNLDVQVMYWAASNAELWYETSNTWMYSWAVDFVNRADVPEVVSVSWGWSELDQCAIAKCNGTDAQQYVALANVQFAKIVARGTTIVVAAGDAGSPGRTNEGCSSEKNGEYWNHINPVFPGGSPWVLSVGATYVVAADVSFDYQTPICSEDKVKCAMGLEEQGITFEMTQWTSGSGFDHWDPTPVWQAKEVSDYLTSGVELPDVQYFNANGRAYPDIAAFGHNCVTHSWFGWNGADGTSCSSPIIAGGIANLNAFQKSRGLPTLGFVNPLLYKMGREMPSTFNDITVGNSTCTEGECCGPQYGFVASKGWDPVGGLGTPNYEQMKKWLLAH